MSIGSNLAHLRKQKRLTQELFAEMMNVTRQTISRWEADEVTPELGKLVEICTAFHCKLDELVRSDMSAKDKIYSDVTIKKLPAFRMAMYVIISKDPEDDVQKHMKRWGQKSGLLAACPDAKLIGWDFPYISQEQQTRFGLHGYAAAYVLPEGYETDCEGVCYCSNSEATYAMITVTEPHIQPFERIPTGYKHIMGYMQANNFKDKITEGVLPCFEYEYEKDGVWYMDIFIHTDSVTKADAYSDLS